MPSVLFLTLLALVGMARCDKEKCETGIKKIALLDISKVLNVEWTVAAAKCSRPQTGQISCLRESFLPDNDQLKQGTMIISLKQSGENVKGDHVWKKTPVKGIFDVASKDPHDPDDHFTTTFAVFHPDDGFVAVRCYVHVNEPTVIVATRKAHAGQDIVDKLIAEAKKNGVNVDKVKHINQTNCD